MKAIKDCLHLGFSFFIIKEYIFRHRREKKFKFIVVIVLFRGHIDSLCKFQMFKKLRF